MDPVEGCLQEKAVRRALSNYAETSYYSITHGAVKRDKDLSNRVKFWRAQSETGQEGKIKGEGKGSGKWRNKDESDPATPPPASDAHSWPPSVTSLSQRGTSSGLLIEFCLHSFLAIQSIHEGQKNIEENEKGLTLVLNSRGGVEGRKPIYHFSGAQMWQQPLEKRAMQGIERGYSWGQVIHYCSIVLHLGANQCLQVSVG